MTPNVRFTKTEKGPLFTDDMEEAINHIRQYISSNYKVVRRNRPLWWLFERS